MRLAHTLFLLILLFTAINNTTRAQDATILENATMYLDDLNDPLFTNHAKTIIQESQFILLGESHGIVEVGEITQKLYDLGRGYNFNTLCIETDPLAAKVLSEFHDAGVAENNAQNLENTYPWSIPFYNNREDLALFSYVKKHSGTLWGIDQTLMSGFRLGFSNILLNSKDRALQKAVKNELEKAVAGYNEAISTKNFMKAYIFSYDKAMHEQLTSFAQNETTLAILNDLWKTKEIYEHQFSGRFYKNNNERAQLMKSNFMHYYNAALETEKLPKVVFKLGYNHAGRGLTFTNVYDIGNLASELAVSNGMRSFNVLASGVSGFQNRSNPVETNKDRQPIVPSKYISSILVALAKKSTKKYVVIKTEALRDKASKLDKDTQRLIFKFDLIILINDATPLTLLREQKK